MKSIFVVLSVLSVFFYVNAAPEPTEKMKAFHQKCVTETSVDVELVQKARKGDFADDPKLKSYALCMSKLFGMQDADGKINKGAREKVALLITDPAVLDKVMKNCNVEKPTPEETAVNAFKCFYSNTN